MIILYRLWTPKNVRSAAVIVCLSLFISSFCLCIYRWPNTLNFLLRIIHETQRMTRYTLIHIKTARLALHKRLGQPSSSSTTIFDKTFFIKRFIPVCALDKTWRKRITGQLCQLLQVVIWSITPPRKLTNGTPQKLLLCVENSPFF